MKSHAVDLVSLIFGTAFLGIAVLWLVTRFVGLTWPVFGWTVVAGVVVLGAVGIIHALVNSRRDRRPQ
jgi:Flp pilus assembly protein TadB